MVTQVEKRIFRRYIFIYFLLPNPASICYRIYIYFTCLINDADSFRGSIILELF
jgi:hypothetical protein